MPGCMLYATEVQLTLPGSVNIEMSGKSASSGTVTETTDSDDSSKKIYTANPGALVSKYKVDNFPTGVYVELNTGLGSGSIENPQTGEGSWVYNADTKTGQVTLCGRNSAKGENLTLIFSPTDFVANDKISSITLSATGNATFNSDFKQYGLVIAIVDASGNIMGQNSANYTSGTVGTNMFTTLDFDNALVWQDGYKVIAGIVGPQGGGTNKYTIENIKVSAITVPEPATATLSLMALAGLCVRRRRQRV